MAIIPVIVCEKHPSSVILSVQNGLLTVEVSIVIIYTEWDIGLYDCTLHLAHLST